MGARERFDRFLQRQPLHGLDLVGQFAHWTTNCSHMPELHDFDLAIDRIRHRAKKLVNRNLVSGFFHHLSLSSGKCTLAWTELAFR